ncbi:hypothetical protein LVD17_24105 [Fulvivirga ulvae]|uniref:hypothetical protein n=1 Tax=Fulvivirga ulvae TaxID=2904245 RepID=UPI001F41918C|nr:hypothetical protein [Fulvivirga ulvae]UII31381.1 hypothetical protein LVD17_24105 [Fulvivirga ulvae]
MATKTEVEQFLREFKEKMKLTDVFFRDDRGKNAQTLADLEIRPIDRKKILLDLKVVDYAEGPLEDTLYKKSDMWVFGKEVKKNEVYIKISIGYGEGGVICISFHIAEKPMNYRFKEQQ